MKKLSSLMLVGLLACAHPALADPGRNFGFGRGMEDGPGGEERREKFAQELGLTDAQKAQLKALRPSKEERQANREKMKAAHEEFRKLLESDTATDDQIRAEAKKLDAMFMEKSNRRLERMLAMRKILTPDQRKRMRAMFEAHRNRHEGMGGRGGPGGPGDGPDDGPPDGPPDE